MKLWITADYDYDFRKFVLLRERPNCDSLDIAEIEVGDEEAAKLLVAQEAQDALQATLTKLYTAGAPKMRNGRTRWGDD